MYNFYDHSPIIVFNIKHNGYYPLFEFYLNNLFTVNYN